MFMELCVQFKISRPQVVFSEIRGPDGVWVMEKNEEEAKLGRGIWQILNNDAGPRKPWPSEQGDFEQNLPVVCGLPWKGLDLGEAPVLRQMLQELTTTACCLLPALPAMSNKIFLESDLCNMSPCWPHFSLLLGQWGRFHVL